MDTETLEPTRAVATGGEAVPTVTAKRRSGAAPEGADPASHGSRNAAEIARLSAWVTGSCGEPILAD